MLRLLRWRVEGAIPDLPRFVIAVAPHTSNWDFVVGAAAMFALDLDLTFLGKHTLFRPPFERVLRWMGGIPVDRSSAHGVVAESVRAFGEADRRVLAIAPEGTRKAVRALRGTGFLHIAREARTSRCCSPRSITRRAACGSGRCWPPGPTWRRTSARIEAYFADRARQAAAPPQASPAPIIRPSGSSATNRVP